MVGCSYPHYTCTYETTTSDYDNSATDSTCIIYSSSSEEQTITDTSIPTLIVWEEPEEVLVEKPKFKRVRNIDRPKNRRAAIKKPPGGWFFFKG